MENILEQLIRHEGAVLDKGMHVPYEDSEGHLTIGYGHKLANGIPQHIADALLRYDYARALDDCKNAFGWWSELGPVRQDVIVNMCFNLGINGLKGFKRMLVAASMGDYETAAHEMLDSLWSVQVGNRAEELAERMRTGTR